MTTPSGASSALAVVSAMPLLRLGAWEGPLDLLLELARDGRVDLARLSAVELVEQAAAAALGALGEGRATLGEAAGWTVMTASLVALRSRLLLPPDEEERQEAEQAAEALRRAALQRQHMRLLADWLARRPLLGQDTFARGMPEGRIASAPGGADLTTPVHSLARLMLGILRVVERPLSERSGRAAGWRPVPPPLWTPADAGARLRAALAAGLPAEGVSLLTLLPAPGGRKTRTKLQQRTAVASTLLAALEAAREGEAELAQQSDFGELQVMTGPARNERP